MNKKQSVKEHFDAKFEEKAIPLMSELANMYMDTYPAILWEKGTVLAGFIAFDDSGYMRIEYEGDGEKGLTTMKDYDDDIYRRWKNGIEQAEMRNHE